MYKIYTNKVTYSFYRPEHKVSVLLGNSGTGKSELCRLISMHNRGVQTVRCLMTETTDIAITTSGDLTLNEIEARYSNYLIFVDEDNRLLTETNPNELADFINRSDNQFIFILRDFKKVSKISLSTNALYRIENKKNINMLVPIFKDPLYKSIVQKQYIRYVLCEDSKSSLLFFRDYFNLKFNNTVFSSFGKDNIIKSLNKLLLDYKKDILVVIDACAFGSRIFELLQVIRNNPMARIHVLDWKSYEYYLCHSSNIFEKPGSGAPLHNEEKMYEKILKSNLLKYTKSGIYSPTADPKAVLPICLDLNVRCLKQSCNLFDYCNCKIDDRFSYDKHRVYIHYPLTMFTFECNQNYKSGGLKKLEF